MDVPDTPTPAEVKPASSAAVVVPPPLDPEVREDLQYTLENNLERIMHHYACYVSHLCECVKRKGVDVHELCTFLLRLFAFAPSDKYHQQDKMLLSRMKVELKEAKTINDIFDLVGEECASFLNYSIYQSILEKYCGDIDCEEFKYPDKLQAYIDQHSIKEFFDVNPQLEEFTKSSKKLKFKIDIESTSRVARIVNLKSAIAKVLRLKPSALRLYSVEEGCVIATFLIPVHVADAIFSSDVVITMEERKKLQDLSVIWMKCGDYECDMREIDVEGRAE